MSTSADFAPRRRPDVFAVLKKNLNFRTRVVAEALGNKERPHPPTHPPFPPNKLDTRPHPLTFEPS